MIKSNPVNDTAKRKQAPRKKHRHTWQGYSLILAGAEPWLARTMKLALYSVQRRGDLVVLQRGKVDMAARTIRIKQRKTGEDLLIAMGDDLYQVMKECFGSGIPCPYLVHTRPLRTPRRDTKLHPFAVTESHLTHSFAAARDRSGAYDHVPLNLRPSFHDLRALGMFALHKAGFSIEYIQALAGHADAAMTKRYLAGHEQVKPLRVEAGISISTVDWSTVDWQD